MAVLNNGLQLMGVGADLVQIIKGLVLLLAVALRRLQQAPGPPSIIGSADRAGSAGDTEPARRPARTRTGETRARDTVRLVHASPDDVTEHLRITVNRKKETRHAQDPHRR